jgi:hypothetical protein
MDPGAPPPRLFSGGQLLVAAVFGLPLAVAVLASLNWRRLGDVRRSNIALAVGAGLSLIVVAAVALLPDPLARFMPLAACIGTWQWCRTAQAAALREQALEDGRRETWWRALGYCAAVGIASIAIAAGVYKGLGIDASNHVSFGNERLVFYTNGATENDARALGEVLVEDGFLKGGAKQVYVTRSGTDYVVSFVLSEKWEDPEVERYYRELRKSIEKKAFRPTRIRLCNDWLWPKRTIDP